MPDRATMQQIIAKEKIFFIFFKRISWLIIILASLHELMRNPLTQGHTTTWQKYIFFKNKRPTIFPAVSHPEPPHRSAGIVITAETDGGAVRYNAGEVQEKKA